MVQRCGCHGEQQSTAAVILPWHDPLRVAEQAAVLDMLCKGRLRFDAASSMIVNALRDGCMEGESRFYKQPKIAIRPRPQ